MVIFKKVTYRNFLSTGNVSNTIELNKHSSTLITGKNGEGKSTILCALTFALFGKPFRNVNKGQLVNSINGKNCIVELEFSTNGREYVIKRGIKPNVFEIWCDGEMINQDAALKDYQKVLEQQIIKLNYKTFTQVVILGSATFVPFMQLSAIQRREVIEDILDIRVFSLMNSILKDKTASVKDQIQKLESDIASHRNRVISQKKLIEVLETNRQSIIDSIQSKINTNNVQITIIQEKVNTSTKDMEAIRSKANTDDVNQALVAANKMKMKIGNTLDSCNHTVEFFSDNPTCPTCSQDIAEEHKGGVLADINKKIADNQAKLLQVEEALTKLDNQYDKASKYANHLRDYSIDISTYTNQINMLTSQNQEMVQEMNNTTLDTSSLKEEKANMRELAEEAIEMVGTKSELLNTRQLHDVASALLRDTGIKTAIIREYLPAMNKLINKYLSAMDFYVKFDLDESFQEVIKSRGRDAFTYDSFSEGEKRRLDLAILFTWRQIAKMKNSVNTNLMILDEILDGALDGAGIDYFLSIMNQFGDQTNVFVISHKVDQMIDRFDNVVRLEKKNEFSLITTS
jgi:DNA repair exonuclease SbcCD ATPase subunit